MPLQLAPTMLIGLGGTGKDVLLRVRRLLYERHGKKPDGSIGFPIIGYLALDTDPGALNEIADEALSEFVMRNIQFNQGGLTEAIDCSVSNIRFEEYFGGGHQNFPHIFKWMLPEMATYGSGSITNGAGQNRLFGRLAFFDHYRGNSQKPGIRDVLESRLMAITGDAALDNFGQDVEVDRDRLEIVLVYSIAGGTGAGMFLDTSLLARHVVDTLSRNARLHPGTQPFFTHYVVLPEPFLQPARSPRPGQKPRKELSKPEQVKIRENAYICLREMEFFTATLGRSFDLAIPPPVAGRDAVADAAEPWYKVQWERDGEVVEMRAAPWDACYLIGGGNGLMAGSCLTPPEIYQMIAESIFLDFDPNTLGTKKRSIRSNQLAKTLNPLAISVPDEEGRILYKRYVSQRFSTFGLSQIYFDRARMRRAASYRMAWRLISQHWLAPVDAEVETGVLGREDFHGADDGQGGVTDTGYSDDPLTRLSYIAIRNQILLEERSSDREKTWYDRVKEEEQKIKGGIGLGLFAAGVDEPLTDWKARHDEFLRRVRGAGDAGRAWRSFKVNFESLKPEVERRLGYLVRHRLRSHRVLGAMRILEEYASLSQEDLDLLQQVESRPLEMGPWADRLADARRIWPAYCRREAVRLELLRGLDEMRKLIGHSYLRGALEEIRGALRLVHQRVRPTQGGQASERELGSYHQQLYRFKSLLEEKTENRSGVLPFLDARYREMARGYSPTERTVPLLASWNDPDYDSRIDRTLAPAGSAPDWAEIEAQVLEQLGAPAQGEPPGSSRRRWIGVKSLGDVIGRLIPLGADEPPTETTVHEFAKDLAEACEALLVTFARDVSALEQFQRLPNEHEKRETIRKLRIYSDPMLRKDQAVNLPSAADGTPNILLGIAGAQRAEADEFRFRLMNAAEDGRTLLGLEPFEAEDDALVLYQEKVGLPLCHLAMLTELAKAYGQADRPREAHFDFEATRGQLPEIRKFDNQKQRNLSGCVELTLAGIMTRVVEYFPDRKDFRLAERRGIGRPVKRRIGEQLEDVINLAAEDDSVRDNLNRQLAAWYEAAAADRGERLVILWCAIQDLYETVNGRALDRVEREKHIGKEALRDHPLLRVLEQLANRVRSQIEGIDGFEQWPLDRLDIAKIHEIVDDRRREIAERERAKLLKGCYAIISEELPIPVMTIDARLEGVAPPAPPPQPSQSEPQYQAQPQAQPQYSPPPQPQPQHQAQPQPQAQPRPNGEGHPADPFFDPARPQAPSRRPAAPGPTQGGPTEDFADEL